MSQFAFYFFYALIAIFLFYGVWFFLNVWKNKPTWGQVRVMGITASMFILIQILFFIVLAESIYTVISFIADLPLWIDILVFLFVIIFTLTVYIITSRRKKFNKKLFLALVLLPVGFSGFHLTATLVKTGNLLLTKKFGVIFVKSYKNAAKPVLNRNTINGTIVFPNSHELGKLGDRLTTLRLTGMGFDKLLSKNNKIHGIDGIYVKKDTSGNIRQLLVIENKIGVAQLNKSTGQMSDKWIKDQAQKLISSGDIEKQNTGQLILDIFNNQRDIVTKQLWRHNLEEGTTRVTHLGEHAELLKDTRIVYDDKLIENELSSRCKRGTLNCLLPKPSLSESGTFRGINTNPPR